jgi:hypothetical protein
MALIAPHGGRLIDRLLKGKESEEWLEREGKGFRGCDWMPSSFPT